MLKQYSFLFLFLFLILPVLAQEKAISFKHLTNRHGLSQNSISSICQDYKGFMWFGTTDGLNKYDGYKFHVYAYNLNDTNSLTGNLITAIYEDKQKNLWIGTTIGLNLYDRNNNNFIRFKNDPANKQTISHNFINAVYEDSKGNLWIGTDDGLNLFDRKRKIFFHYKHDEKNKSSLSNSIITSICEDPKGNLWIGTRNHGLNLWDRTKKTAKHFLHDRLNKNSISSNDINAMAIDANGNLWVAGNPGISMLNSDGVSFKRYYHDDNDKKSLSYDIVLSLYVDTRGRLWVGTMNGGLNLFHPETESFSHYSNDFYDENSISNNTVDAIYEDKNGTLWVGVHRGGINYSNPIITKFNTYEKKPFQNSISHNNIKALCEDKKGRVWIATDGGGLNVFDRTTNTFRIFKHDPKDNNSISGDVILSVYEDRNGNLWAGILNGMLDRYDEKNNRFIHFTTDSLDFNAVWSMTEDKAGTLWIGMWLGGLVAYDPKNNKINWYRPTGSNNNNGLTSKHVMIVHADKKNNIWIGTGGHGLFRFNISSKQFTHYLHNEKEQTTISHNMIDDIYEDSKQNIWIGTRNGLNLYQSGTNSFRAYRKADGLPSDAARAIIEDNNGNLWISTLNGLSKFHYESKTFKNYTEGDGLQGNEFSHAARLKTRNGELFFGGRNGFNSFFPDSIKENLQPPPVYLTNFHVFNKPVGIGKDSILTKHITEAKEIRLSHKQSVFSFEFAALNFLLPEKNQYAYMLEGFDKEWVFVGNQRSATYTNLDPAEYIFKLKASNNDGVWNEEGASIRLIITPPIWMTWWFKTLAVAILLACFITFYRVRIGMIKRQKKVLETVVEMRTKEIKQKNELLRNQQLHLEQLVAQRTEELTETNQELIVAKQQMQDMMDNSAAVIYIKSPDGRYLFINRQYEKLFNVSREQVRGLTAYDIFQKDVADIITANDRRVFEASHSITAEETTPLDGNPRTFVAVRFPMYDNMGKVYAIGGISTDITDRKQVEEALRQLSAYLQEVREEERINIAREIHDELGQQLTGIKMDVAWMSKKVEVHEKDLKQKLSGIVSLIDEMIKSVRRISTQLRPSILDDLGLIAAIDWHSQEFEKRSGIKTSFYSDIHELSISPNVATGLFRIYQESLTNVARHAEASKVSTILQIQNGELILKISDNGKGFDISKTAGKKTLGLLGMKERTLMMGGKYEIISEPDKGATVWVSVPL